MGGNFLDPRMAACVLIVASHKYINTKRPGQDDEITCASAVLYTLMGPGPTRSLNGVVYRYRVVRTRRAVCPRSPDDSGFSHAYHDQHNVLGNALISEIKALLILSTWLIRTIDGFCTSKREVNLTGFSSGPCFKDRFLHTQFECVCHLERAKVLYRGRVWSITTLTSRIDASICECVVSTAL